MRPIDLDNIALYRRYDPEGMVERIRELPQQCRQAWQQAMDFHLPAGYADIDKIVILGMGGSAIGADLLRSLLLPEIRLPVIVHRDYGLPTLVDARTLVIASSYSGNTEETLSGFQQALVTGARKLAITTGGRLEKMAVAEGIPVFRIDYRAQPRAALGFSFLPMLGILQRLGLVTDRSEQVAETIRVLEGLVARLDERSPGERNLAKQLARRLYGRLPVIYGAGITAEAAHRWKTQINENSKVWAFYEVLPELNHNATVGYPLPKEIAKKAHVVFLRSPLLNPRLHLRYRVTAELLKRAGVVSEMIDGVGESALAQMMSLVMIGDFTSYYLAILYRVDPSPVEVISYLKERLEKGE